MHVKYLLWSCLDFSGVGLNGCWGVCVFYSLLQLKRYKENKINRTEKDLFLDAEVLDAEEKKKKNN